MKKLLTILLILISFSGFSQNWNRVYYRPGYQYNGLKADSILITPNDTLRNKVVGSIAVKNNQLYIKEINKWKMLTGVDILSSYRLLNNHDSLSTLKEKSYNSLTDKPNLLIYRLNNDHDSLSTLQEKSYNSLDNKPDLTIYRPLNNHDSLSTLQEKSYNSLDDKPTIPDVTSYRLKSDHDSLSTLQEKNYSSLDGKPDLTVYKEKSDSTNSDGYVRRDRLTTELNKKADKTALTTKADLDGNGKVLSSQMPSIAISETFVVSSQSAMLALITAETGDVAVRNDINKSFILTQNPSSTLSNWQELLTPTDAVSSVNGQTGTVSLTTSNINEGSNLYYTDVRVAANSAVAANTAKVSFPGFGTDHTKAAYGDHLHAGVYQPAGSYLTVESDPVFSAWNKSTGISITKSQVSDFPTQLSQFTNNLGNYGNFWNASNHPTTTADYGLPAYPTSLPASDVYPWAKAATKPSYVWTEIGSRPTALSQFTNDLGNYGNFLISETDPNVYAWAKAATKPSYNAGEVGADATGTASTLLSNHNSTYDHSHIANGQAAYNWGNWADHFGTGAGTIAQGNDSRINHGETAFNWGNHDGLYLGRGINTWQTSSDGKNRFYFGNGGDTYIGSPLNWNFQNMLGNNVVSIDYNGIITAYQGNSTQWNSAYTGLNASGLTTNYLPKWDGSKLVNSLISDDGTNVIVRTGGTTGFNGVAIIGGNDANTGFEVAYDTDGYTNTYLFSKYANNSSAVHFGFGSTMSTSGAKMSLFGNGNFHVGYTTDQGYKFAVNGNAYVGGSVTAPHLVISDATAYTQVSSTTGTNRAFYLASNTGGNYYFGAENSAGNGIFDSGGTAYALGITTAGAKPVQIGTNGIVRLTIEGSNGNATFTGSITATGGGFNSSRKLKDIHPDWKGSAVKAIKEFKLRDFSYKVDSGKNRTLGFIIDEIPKCVEKYVVREGEAVNTYTLHGLSFKAHQEESERIEKLEKGSNLNVLFNEYKQDCYNDSTYVEYTKQPDYSPYANKETGAVCAIYLYPIKVKEWQHKQPTFDGFMSWLNIKNDPIQSEENPKARKLKSQNRILKSHLKDMESKLEKLMTR